ncbi:MAG: alpha/beta hydrolase-fold protein [Bacteroidota bacterium]
MSSFRSIELSDTPYEWGGLRFMTVKSQKLKGRGDICLYLPLQAKELENLPIYILLHGVYGSAWIWALKGGVHHTAQKMMDAGEIKPAILAMPSDGLWGDGSAYIEHQKHRYDRWIVEDVPQAILENISQAGEDSKICIGGLSMGGYGALRLGASFPSAFEAISGHSSITKLEQMGLFVEEALEEYTSFCEEPNVVDLMIRNRSRLPALRFDCGNTDLLIKANRELHTQLEKENIPHHYEEFPGGHEWPYWQEHVAKSLRFFDQHCH